MALYTIVKNTTFNGINLPDIAVIKKSGEIKVIKVLVTGIIYPGNLNRKNRGFFVSPSNSVLKT